MIMLTFLYLLFFFILGKENSFHQSENYKENSQKTAYRAHYKGTFPPTPSPVKRANMSKGKGNAHALLVYTLLGGVILVTFVVGLSLFLWHSSKSTKLKEIASYFDIIAQKSKSSRKKELSPSSEE